MERRCIEKYIEEQKKRQRLIYTEGQIYKQKTVIDIDREGETDRK